ncbi:MAG: T9SS type A sorting domain-containing protein [Bacteroidales bacterium]|nr:T9SS type A sorting domain-containing protein [Bacteroidales bacterium]
MKIIILLLLLNIAGFAYTQTEPADYFGQTPPGDSAVIFAPGIISLPDRNESGIIFSADGKECYITVIDDRENFKNKLYYSSYNETTWTYPVEISFLEGFNPCALFFSADNKKIYFTNQIFDDNHIWVVERDTAAWSEPTKLLPPINSDDNELGYSETTDGHIYFSSHRDNLTTDIWHINQLTGQAENLGIKVNSTSGDHFPIVSPDDSYVILQSYRKNALSNLYVCFNKGNNDWTFPVDLGSKINIPQQYQVSTSLSPEGKYLFFCRTNDLDNKWDIYWVSTSFIPKLKKTAYAPQLANQIPDIIIAPGSNLNYVIPENTFTCEYEIDSLIFAANLSNGEALPVWLDFDPRRRTFSGISTEDGTFEVTITVTNPDSLSASCNFNIVSITTSVNQNKKPNIKVFPNPANNTLFLEYQGAVEKEMSYAIVNVNGRTIQQKQVTSNIIDISGLEEGIYFFTIYNREEIIIKKIHITP